MTMTTTKNRPEYSQSSLLRRRRRRRHCRIRLFEGTVSVHKRSWMSHGSNSQLYWRQRHSLLLFVEIQMRTVPLDLENRKPHCYRSSLFCATRQNDSWYHLNTRSITVPILELSAKTTKQQATLSSCRKPNPSSEITMTWKCFDDWRPISRKCGSQ